MPVKALSKLFRRLMVDKLIAAHTGRPTQLPWSSGSSRHARAFKRFLAPVRRRKWFVYAKRPFAGPKAVLAYLSRYTHRVAISNRRLISMDQTGVTFRVKDYRRVGPARYTTMTLRPHEFIRRLLMHVLPKGLHRIRHYGLFASGAKVENLTRMRALLGVPEAADIHAESEAEDTASPSADDTDRYQCPTCGGQMRIIEVFAAGCSPRHTSTRRRDRQFMTLHATPDMSSNRRPPRCNSRPRPMQCATWPYTSRVARLAPKSIVQPSRNDTQLAAMTRETALSATSRDAKNP